MFFGSPELEGKDAVGLRAPSRSLQVALLKPNAGRSLPGQRAASALDRVGKGCALMCSKRPPHSRSRLPTPPDSCIVRLAASRKRYCAPNQARCYGLRKGQAWLCCRNS